MAGPRSARIRLGSPGQAKPMNLSDHRIAGQSAAEQARNLACALAFAPMLLQLLDSFVRPRHRRLVRQIPWAKSTPLIRRVPPPCPAGAVGRNADQHSLRTLATTSRGPEGKNYTTR